jgi:hypothetical protein
MENPQADLLLRYWEVDALRPAEAAMQSSLMSAEKLLYAKAQDPVAAALGAYLLLSFGELNRLEDWAQRLVKYNGWLSDGFAIYGEYLARTGEHAQAVRQFRSLCSVGVPIFSAGLFLCEQRLREYSRLMSQAPSRDLEQIGLAVQELGPTLSSLERIRRFNRSVDFRRRLTVFRSDGKMTAQESAGC